MKKILFFTVIFTFGCSATGNNDSWLTSDEIWERNVIKLNKFKSIDVGNIYEVKSEKVEQALELLTEVEFIPVTEEAVSEFIGAEFKSNKRAFLVRAVSGNENGEFYVQTRDRYLFITHITMGNLKEPENTAIIVELAFEPIAIFSTIGSDQ